MVKKLFIIVMLCWAVMLQAQPPVGQWQTYPTWSTTPGKIFDTADDVVYYMSGINLYSYDKVSNEMETYNTGNYLSDSGIKNIYYNYDKKYLMIVYENSNIDLLYGNKKVVNIPDLKNTIMMTSKSINDVVFSKDKIYLATDFGVLIINDKKNEIYESYIYDKAVSKIAIAGNKLLVIIDSKMYIADIKSSMYEFDENWSLINLPSAVNTKVSHLYTINEDNIFLSYDEDVDGTVVAHNYIYNITENSFTEQTDMYAKLYYAKNLGKTKTGFMASFDTAVRFFKNEITGDKQLILIEQKDFTQSSLKNGFYSSYDDNRSIWCSTASGVSHVEISGSNVTWLINPSTYNTSNVTTSALLLIHNNKLYVKNSGPCMPSGGGFSEATQISVMDCDTRQWSVLSLDKVYNGGGSNKIAIRSSYNMVFDPENQNIFYVGSWFDGIHKFDGTTYIDSYDQYNSPLTHPWSMRAMNSDFDNDGNLWNVMVENSVYSNTTCLACLPRNKNLLPISDITINDWETYDVGANVDYFVDLLVAKRNPLCFVINGVTVASVRVMVVNRETKATRIFNSFIDQDGSSVGSGILNFRCAAEDKDGNVWIGTTSGPIVLNNVANIMNPDFRCTRVKVPRNDGTDYADYLLEDESINTIVVDGANRKWLGTGSSGVYLVSEDGTEILQHYTTENSLLLSNTIYDMAINDATGELFVATSLGVASYRSDVSNPAEDYSNVIAFPNPVRPEYGGWITISGLMDNSLVKITDVAGNLFYEGYSNGGTISWDGRNRDGKRVKTGVYLVYASSAQGDKSSGVVTKIMVVN